jgi:hypothetical protein
MVSTGLWHETELWSNSELILLHAAIPPWRSVFIATRCYAKNQCKQGRDSVHWIAVYGFVST